MTEAEWLVCDSPGVMLEFVRDAAGDRKLRLFAAGCCRRVWKFFADDRYRGAVEAAEAFADDRDTVGSLDYAAQGVRLAVAEWRRRLGSAGVLARVGEVCQSITRPSPHYAHLIHLAAGIPTARNSAILRNSVAQSGIARCAFGNLFRPATFSPAWRTGDVLALTRLMYESRDFGGMPILADALQEAGCDCEDILNHCRDASVTHTRGCWVADLVLGME